MTDSLGDRMKRQYEDRTRVMLPRRTYTILRADGKAFHTYTRKCERPYDAQLVGAMNVAALALVREAQGSVFGYVQSDEISILLTDFATITTEAWFDGNLQKIVSVAASTVTQAFYEQRREQCEDGGAPVFDCRAFTIPDPIEVENYFIWRQQDAARNSIQSTAQAHFSHKQLHGLNVNELQELLFKEKGINWNDLPAEQKRGRVVRYADGCWEIDNDAPQFTKDREYLRALMRPDAQPENGDAVDLSDQVRESRPRA